MNILTAACPTWCSHDLPTDEGGVVHISADRDVATTAGGSAEIGMIRVGVERFDADGCAGTPAIRIEGSGQPMTPLQAFELATTIQAAAISALLGDEATR